MKIILHLRDIFDLELVERERGKVTIITCQLVYILFVEKIDKMLGQIWNS